jgi:hypothetical protein
MGCKDIAIISCVLATLAAPRLAFADEPQGAEFIDMPEGYEPEASSAPAAEADETERPAYVPGYRAVPSLGLSPYTPQNFSSLPGGVTPSFGSPVSAEGWRFEFSGYLQQPIVAAIGKRQAVFVGQKETTLHGDPVVPGGSYGWFDHTQTVPNPWAQVNFHYGNKVVKATAIIGSWTIGQSAYAANYVITPSQLWFNDAFLTYTPDIGAVKMRTLVGVYPDRYGAMAKYGGGAYGLALMGQLDGMGTTTTLAFPFENEVTFSVEGGVKGDFRKSPLGIVQDGSNEYPLEEQGSTFGAHGHFSAAYEDKYTLSLHYIHTWSQDDRTDNAVFYDAHTTQAYPMDGSIDVSGVDLRTDIDRFGYLYVGLAHLAGKNANSVTNLLKFLNNGGGKELNNSFWGFASNGNGSMTILAGQYTLSLGTLLRHPREFWGDGPDLQVSVFGMYGHVGSEADTNPAQEYSEPGSAELWDANMFKVGQETTYSLLPWLAASFRADYVSPDTRNWGRSFAVLSPKLIFRTDWQTREALTLQYAGYLLGDAVVVQGDSRLYNTTSGNPDKHLLALYGTMWW